jgi:hypothetical protein
MSNLFWGVDDPFSRLGRGQTAHHPHPLEKNSHVYKFWLEKYARVWPNINQTNMTALPVSRKDKI